MCAGIHRYTLCMASSPRTSQHFSRHLRRQSPSHAVFPTFSAHISTPKPTSAQPNPDSRPESYPLCALLGISSDICAGNPPPTPYFQLSLHTSQLPNRHLRNQSLTHALSGILHAHMSSLCLAKHPSVIPSPHPVILSDSEESGSSSLIFSSSPSPDMCAGIHRYTLCMASRLRTSPHFPRHLRRQSPSHAVFPTFPAHISTPKPTSAQTIPLL